jgi:hypothetical protein
VLALLLPLSAPRHLEVYIMRALRRDGGRDWGAAAAAALVTAALMLLPPPSSSAAGAAPDLSNGLDLANSSLAYLGFWGPDQPQQMQSFTNLQFANSAAQAVEQGRHGIHALIKTHGVAINMTTRWHWRLLPDFEQRLRRLEPQLAPLLTNGSLLGFFLGDELLWNGLPFIELQAYSATMRAVFGHKAVLYENEAWPSLIPTMKGAGQYAGDLGATPDAELLLHVPAELDWFSVDIYPDMFSPGGLVTMYHSFIRPKMLSNQSFVLVPPFYGERNATRDTVTDCDDSDCDAAMARWADVCARWVQGRWKDSERIVAAMPFHWMDLWRPGTEGSRALGGKELPKARARWEQLGRAVVQKERRRGQPLLPVHKEQLPRAGPGTKTDDVVQLPIIIPTPVSYCTFTNNDGDQCRQLDGQ